LIDLKTLILSKNRNFYGTSWILPQIETLYANWIIASRDETIAYNPMSRADFAKILSNLWWYTPTQCLGTVYNDVNSSLWNICWYIEALGQAWVYSTQSSSFFPLMNITNGELYKMILTSIWEAPVSWTGYIQSSLFGTGEFAWYAQK